MDKAMERRVWRRARACCEYCRMPQEHDMAPFEIDHIIARKHEGPTSLRNLALSCSSCNAFKGSNVAGIEKRTRRVVPLFNPHRQSWARHFRWRGPVLVGRTAIGRVTIAVLRINDPFRVELRRHLLQEGLFSTR